MARDAIARAGLREREAEILGAHVAGYGYVSIAEAKGITARTVERQLLRARRKLRDSRKRQQRHAERLPPAGGRASSTVMRRGGGYGVTLTISDLLRAGM